MNLKRNALRIAVMLAVAIPAITVTVWWIRYWSLQKTSGAHVQADIIRGVTVSGTIRCKRRAAVAAETIAAVTAIFVEEGQQVRKGQPLVKLGDSVIAAECDKARARLDLAMQQLAEFQAGERKQEITKAIQAVKRAKSDVEFAEKELARIKVARRKRVATDSEVNLASNRLDVANAALAAAEAQLEMVQAGVRTERIARAKAEVNLAEGELSRCEALRNQYSLLAPHDGIVTVRYVHVGEIVSPGQVLLRVEDITSIEVRAQVQESQLRGVKVGRRASVLVDAYPQQPLPAVVEQILPRVNPEQGTVTVILRLIGEPKVMLMDGMSADIAIVEQYLTTQATTPETATEEENISLDEQGRTSALLR